VTKKRAKSKKRKTVSPEVRARANARIQKRILARRARKGPGKGTPPEVIEKLFSPGAELPKQDAKADKQRVKEARKKAALERRLGSSTPTGKANPVPRGKMRGTGAGRMTRGS